ncbi:HIT domain-containing protein [Candidatus Peribacteria bacterium]|nr:HIT domain-containing protein [Candidatus Peribacteria bacterium]
MRKSWLIPSICISVLIGIFIGGYLFSGVQQRSLLAFHHCERTCLDQKELLGLIGAVLVQKIPGALPHMVLETDKTVVIEHPRPLSDIHYVAIPKRDIHNALSIQQEDIPYLIDIYASLQYLIDKEKLTKYTISTNGPGYQMVDYLHFHLRAER